MRYWKVLNGTVAEHTGFDFKPYLPKDGQYGAVLPPIDNVYVCERGWHFSTDSGLRQWLRTKDVYSAFPSGKSHAGTHTDKRAFASGQLGPRLEVTDRTFALFALEGLNSLPVKRLSTGQREHLNALREELFRVVVGELDLCDLEQDSNVYHNEELADQLEELYNDYGRTMPPAVTAECTALRGSANDPFYQLREALYEATGDVAALIEGVPDAIQELHRQHKGPLNTSPKAFAAFGDVLEGEFCK